MSYQFSVHEILEMAVHIEENGAKFYRDMTENISDSSIRQLFFDLAAMEEEHQKVFIAMNKDLSDRERKPTVFDPQGELVQYLRALAELRVFHEKTKDDFNLPEELSKGEKTGKILQAALDLEKDSIVFYLGMRELVPEQLGKKKIDKIIKEEMGHIKVLINKLTSL